MDLNGVYKPTRFWPHPVGFDPPKQVKVPHINCGLDWLGACEWPGFVILGTIYHTIKYNVST